MERCTTCQFYDRQKGNGESKTHSAGLCRRNAPQLSPLNQKSYMIEGVWPTVRGDDSCGEWKASTRRPDASRPGEVFGAPLTSPLSSPLFSPPPGVPARHNGDAPRSSSGVRAVEVAPSTRSIEPRGLGAD
jgi:hypothetical protein